MLELHDLRETGVSVMFDSITFKRPNFTAEAGTEVESKSITPELTPQVTGEVTGEVFRLLSVLVNSSLTRTEIQSALDLKSQANFRDRYLEPALKMALIEMTMPNKPTSRLQQYRIAEKGRAVIAGLNRGKKR